MAVLVGIFGPSTASAYVDVNVPTTVGTCIKVGVSRDYRTGGNYRARIRIQALSGRTSWSKRVVAPKRGWRFYKICPKPGGYKVIYNYNGSKDIYHVRVI
jgi:hypothetical protein